jgi:hypothetical protein
VLSICDSGPAGKVIPLGRVVVVAWNADCCCCCCCDVVADDGPAGKSIKSGCSVDVAADGGRPAGKFIQLLVVVVVVRDDVGCCDVVADDDIPSIRPPVVVVDVVLDVVIGSVLTFVPGGTLRLLFSGPSLRLALIACNDRKASSAACGVMML